MDWDTHTKNTIRNIVCKETKEPYLSVLLLPSGMCLDVKQMLTNKAIDLDTRIVAVERDRLLAGVIRGKLQDLGFNNFEVHQKDLEAVDLSKESFDFVYLDTCGQLTPQLLGWMVEQVQTPAFKKTKSINLAFCSSYRKQGLIKHFCKFMTKNKIKSTKTREKLMGLTAEKSKFQIREHKATATMLAMLFGAVEESFIYKNSAKGAPMHVFTFQPRKLNTGITPMIKFLKTLGIEPVITGAGVKAALKRKGHKTSPTPKLFQEAKARSMKMQEPTLKALESTPKLKYDREQVIEAYKRLGTYKKAAKELGISFATVSNYVRGLNFLGAKRGRKRTNIDSEVVSAALLSGENITRLAKRLGLPRTTLNDFIQKHELARPPLKVDAGKLNLFITKVKDEMLLPPPCNVPLPKFIKKDSLAKVRADLHNILKRLEVLENEEEVTYV